MSARLGFTLIELLVVIAIMGVVGVFSLANFRSFGDDQKLKNSLLDIQSLLRTAQTNTTAGSKCNLSYGAAWTVEFAGTTNINLKCTEPGASAVLKKSITPGSNIEIQQITGAGSGCPGTISLPLSISFSPKNKQIDLGNVNCTSVTVVLKNNKNSTKSLIIEPGGRIYER